MQKLSKTILFFSLFLGSIFALGAKAQSETSSFSVDSSYDLYGRKEIEAVLVRSTSLTHFYIEKSWWDGRSAQEQNDLRIALAELGLEFQNKIYPVLTSTFGSEPRPGIDKDERITILVHEMGGEAGGYFRSGDVYETLQSPGSNEREMIYLNSQYVGTSEAKGFLAHEFVHLITINQKDLLRRIAEETWLNEARAEYAPTLLGYDDIYKGSNLERRVRDFVTGPSDPLVAWLNKKEDYGVVSVFIHYLVDHYGVKILGDSLQSFQAGIPSINEALRKNGFQQDFTQIFSDWTIAALANDCALGARHCFVNKHLQNLRITPVFYYLPGGETIFSTYHTAPYWSASWHRLTGGGQNLTLEFEGTVGARFNIPYVLCDSKSNCSVKFLSLDEKQKGTIVFREFSSQYSSLTIIPFAASTPLGGNGGGSSFPFSWKVSVKRELGVERESEPAISQLLARIAELQEQARLLRALVAARPDSSRLIPGQGNVVPISCGRFESNLFFGMNNGQVRCLQEFLSAQGSAIYPEGLVTGSFLSLTRQAVVRFQEKYASEVLAPLGLRSGTGYVGQMTRNKINQMIGSLVAL